MLTKQNHKSQQGDSGYFSYSLSLHIYINNERVDHDYPISNQGTVTVSIQIAG